jgi:flavin reductase (DIM6/NTAB) family NADH-FMN oxidoreductase RutF
MADERGDGSPGGETLVPLVRDGPLWSRFVTVAPLVLVATKEGDRYDIAPKHMAMPLGWSDYYCFVCSPRHATYRNAARHGAFTVSFPHPHQIVETSMAASGRVPGGGKPGLQTLPTRPATAVDGVLVTGCRLFLECELHELIDGYGENSLVVGRVVAALAEESSLRLHDRDDGDLIHDAPLLAYLSPGRFAIVSESYSFPFSEDFSL